MIAALAVFIAALSGASVAGGDDALVREGRRWWTTSPDPDNPVSCATCHDDEMTARAWSSSFPKFRPLPPPHARVMTLLQANAEAIARHYRVADPLPAATAVTAFLTRLGDDRPLPPGVVDSRPVFPERLRALAAAMARGARAYDARCRQCHAGRDVAPSVRRFPCGAGGALEPLEVFMQRHAGLPWDAAITADVAAYLTALAAGRDVVAGGPDSDTREGP